MARQRGAERRARPELTGAPEGDLRGRIAAPPSLWRAGTGPPTREEPTRHAARMEAGAQKPADSGRGSEARAMAMSGTRGAGSLSDFCANLVLGAGKRLRVPTKPGRALAVPGRGRSRWPKL